jgi:hypothetical protein
VDFLMEIIMDFFIEPKVGGQEALLPSSGGNSTIPPLPN